MYEGLGITEAMKARIKPQPTPAQIAQSVASGDTELGVFLTNVLTAPGIDLVGPFPPEVQMEVVYTAAVSAGTQALKPAKVFIPYPKASAAAAGIKSKGSPPSSPRYPTTPPHPPASSPPLSPPPPPPPPSR